MGDSLAVLPLRFRGPATAGLRKREWDRADGQKQKHVKGASNKMRFDGGIDLFFQFMRLLVVSRSDESKKGSAVSPRSPNPCHSNFLSFW